METGARRVRTTGSVISHDDLEPLPHPANEHADSRGIRVLRGVRKGFGADVEEGGLEESVRDGSFLGVVGAHTAHPTATSAATPRQVTDVSSAAFADAPYAVPYDATEQSGGAAYCNGSFGSLVPGCNYIVWGSGIDYNTAMDTQLSCGSGTSCWQGQLDPSSSHALGQTVTAKSGAGGGPSPLLSGAKYILLPVISDEGVVVQYGLFTVTGNSKIYTLARTPDPVNSVTAPIAQSETTGAWMPNDEGAVSIKLVDPTYFNATGWS